MLMTVASRSAASTAAFVACDRISILILLAPKLDFILLSALDASFAHLDVVLDFSFRELSVLPENDVEAQTKDAKSDKY